MAAIRKTMSTKSFVFYDSGQSSEPGCAVDPQGPSELAATSSDLTVAGTMLLINQLK